MARPRQQMAPVRWLSAHPFMVEARARAERLGIPEAQAIRGLAAEKPELHEGFLTASGVRAPRCRGTVKHVQAGALKDQKALLARARELARRKGLKIVDALREVHRERDRT